MRTKSDAVCLSAGGCVAYYPTMVPFRHRSEWLGAGDPFGELVAGCHKLGMVVIARAGKIPPRIGLFCDTITLWHNAWHGRVDLTTECRRW